eukprot:764012-Hanusia_phi.AAC.3
MSCREAPAQHAPHATTRRYRGGRMNEGEHDNTNVGRTKRYGEKKFGTITSWRRQEKRAVKVWRLREVLASD